MNTALIGVENPSRSFFAEETKKALVSSCSPIYVLDILGDIDNLIEVPLTEWAKAKQKLLDEIGGGLRMRHFIAFEREPIKRLLPGHIQVFTLVRLVKCEEKLAEAVMITDPIQPSGGVLGSMYSKARDKIAKELRVARDSGHVGDFQVSYGFGFEFPTGILIEGLYETVFHLGKVVEKLHRKFDHQVKTVSYISMR